eukprot:CAMPEP_0170736890 /NCGR_PEP_ID=MMETSP0437-20130122/3845_1 /TAXON_ID=0 /ORGANISM="Sexangularia sp." /LENGTH=376 /DNA_ID=CAMNT_0011075261 /DNA_START=72 /DNA_END=1198 /DNA_ORIENTATION=+
MADINWAKNHRKPKNGGVVSSGVTSCSFFARGACTRGDDCPYAHARVPCAHFAAGYCAFGDKCRNAHVRREAVVVKEKPRGAAVVRIPAELAKAVPPPLAGGQRAARATAPSASAPPAGLTIVDDTPSSLDWDHTNLSSFADGRSSGASAASDRLGTTTSQASSASWARTTKLPTGFVTAPPSNAADTARKAPRKTCQFYAAGTCRYGSDCRYAHEGPTVGTVAPTAPPDGGDDSPSFPECSICLEVPATKYGLLLNCSHAFCLGCIRAWRSARETDHESGAMLDTTTTRSCPICRTWSPYILPSPSFTADHTQKHTLQQSFTSWAAKTPCREEREDRPCPFGTSCLFRHSNTVASRLDGNGDVSYHRDDEGVSFS